MSRFVEVVHTFKVDDDVPDDYIHNIVGAMTVQVDENVVEYDKDGNERSIDVYDVQRRTTIVDPVTQMEPDLERFLTQNELCAKTLTERDIASMNEYAFAEHHSGGLFVLGRLLNDERRYLKMHDSWGDDGRVVVHAYDPNAYDDTDEEETYFAKGTDAYGLFLNYEERQAERLCRYCGVREDLWDAGDCRVSEHGFHIPLGASDLIHLAGDPGEGPVCGTVQEAITTGDHDLVTCSMCQQAAMIDPDSEVEGVRVKVTRSAGGDRAVVVFIDTTFEPDGSDGGPGLRVLINDDPTYVGRDYVPKED